MMGTEQHCRDAGMDAYLTKPLDRALLDETISRHLRAMRPQPEAAREPQAVSAMPAAEVASTEDSGVVAPTHTPQEDPVDWEEFIANTDGDVEFAGELVQVFIESGDAVLRDIRDALQRGDAPALRQAAHSLKGSSASMCARATSEAAALLEAAARAGEMSKLAALEARLRSEAERAIQYMRKRQA
jgi:HPt (histidine-containing phosphotransfer) domain-containing protein